MLLFQLIRRDPLDKAFTPIINGNPWTPSTVEDLPVADRKNNMKIYQRVQKLREGGYFDEMSLLDIPTWENEKGSKLGASRISLDRSKLNEGNRLEPERRTRNNTLKTTQVRQNPEDEDEPEDEAEDSVSAGAGNLYDDDESICKSIQYYA